MPFTHLEIVSIYLLQLYKRHNYMKKTLFYCSFLFLGIAQATNPFDVVIAQIDNQSKELNQHIASSQQDGHLTKKYNALSLR